MERLDRYRGALLGLAVGDAVGTTLEFRAAGTFTPVTDMVGGGPFGLQAGQWTDDTSMALCLTESLLERGGFDSVDQLRRYVRWWREGHWSSTGVCFDIGTTTARALSRFERNGQPDAGSTDPMSAGNGSLMRLAPIPLAYLSRPAEIVEMAARSSATTHGARAAIDACRLFSALLAAALQGTPRGELLDPAGAVLRPFAEDEGIHPEIRALACGEFRDRDPARDVSGYVVDTLSAALWAVGSSNDFSGAVLRAVNLGGDADTAGAVCGQLAGALYGEAGIPAHWRSRLAMRESIAALADRLHAFAWGTDAPAVPPHPLAGRP